MLPIEIRDVTLVYDTPGGKVPGVKDVSFNIDASEFLCIVGPSGCGKSTLLNMIAGFLSPGRGRNPHRRQGGHRPRHGPRRGVPGFRPVVSRGAPRSATSRSGWK